MLIPPIVLVFKRRVLVKRNDLVESPLPKIVRHSDKMIILGNGPSLNVSVDKYKETIASCDKMVVNFFASTDLYELFKPQLYVLADPAYFVLPDKLKASVLSLFDDMVRKTTWPLHVIVPLSRKDSTSLNVLRACKNITIDYYFDGFQSIGNMSKFEAWDNNLIAPPAQTVLNTCLYLSLYWNYKETYLIGADTSFLEDVRIDQDTNELYVIDKHFYQAEKTYSSNWCSSKGAKKEGWSLHDLIWAYGNMFKMYSDLKEYADYKGLKVYNASEYSWINVFERKKLL